jgi:Arm DNA-binding domain
MRSGKLTARGVESILAGRGEKRYHCDGAGLWLVVSRRDDDGKPQSASWVYRYMLDGVNHEIGLGSVWDVSLGEAREAARNARRRVRVDKIDVLAERREQDRQRRDRARIQANQTTFR